MSDDIINKIHNNPIIDNKTCYVAFLDILGFKSMINEWKPDRIKSVFDDIFFMSNKLKACKSWPLGNSSKKASDFFNECHRELFVYIMSDSIVLAIESDSPKKLHFLLYACDIIQKFLFDSEGILVRGGISKGWFHGESFIAFGKGFVDAYTLEGKAKYPRIIIDAKLNDELEESPKDWLYDFTKGEDYWYINWLKNIVCSDNDIRDFCKNRIEDNKKINDEEKRKSIIEKYEWILDRLQGT